MLKYGLLNIYKLSNDGLLILYHAIIIADVY